MYRITLLLISILTFCMSDGYGQELIADFSFDGCIITDAKGNYNDNEVRNNIDCVCGVGDNTDALIFDGSADTIFMDSDLKDVFTSDFSMSFYFWVEDATEEYPIFSIRNTCSKDSSFIIRYLPFSGDLEVEFTANALDGVFMRADINPDICWHHFLFTRSQNTFSLYIDGRFVETFEELTPLALGVDNPVTIGYSPCIDASIPNSDLFFRGRLDNLQFYNFAFESEEERLSLLAFPDEIITSDTTIFEGDIIDIVSGPTCAPDVRWTPTTDLSEPNQSNTMASPIITTTYDVIYDHGTCMSQDNITISVISEDDIDCNEILLPTAFTPNNDGLNDEFGISNAFVIENLTRLEIYDRWGLLLYESLNKNRTWDGTYKQTPMPPGVYVYKIEYSCQGDVFRKTGSFNILK